MHGKPGKMGIELAYKPEGLVYAIPAAPGKETKLTDNVTYFIFLEESKSFVCGAFTDEQLR